jgi:hypothetical protein
MIAAAPQTKGNSASYNATFLTLQRGQEPLKFFHGHSKVERAKLLISYSDFSKSYLTQS